MLHGLTQLNVELTSRCDKHTLCKFCGHQDPAVFPTLTFGDMAEDVLLNIAFAVHSLGKSLVVQFHRDGDPLAASEALLCTALFAFRDNLRSIVTHGERLGERGQALIGNCESVCVSIFRGDPDKDLQIASVRSFLDQKGDQLPRVSLKVVGDMSDDELSVYQALEVPLLRRKIHGPSGNARYARGVPSMPEHGICLDLLHHPSITWDGFVYLCNRLDTNKKGIIGDLATESLDAIWNGSVRQQAIAAHVAGHRDTVPACADCRYYGIPAC